jgi:hypothetical protein
MGWLWMAGVQTTTPPYNASFVGGVGRMGVCVVLLQQTIEMLRYAPLKKRRRARVDEFWGVAGSECWSEGRGFVASTEGEVSKRC